MIKILFKLVKLLFSVAVLSWMISMFPPLSSHVGIEGLVGFFLGVIYVKDPTGRYHYGWDGRYVSSEEGLCLGCILPLLGVALPAAITIYSLPMYAVTELLTATFGAEIVGLIGGSGILE